jgi:uncharacterized coiled-coil protein SlyX
VWKKRYDHLDNCRAADRAEYQRRLSDMESRLAELQSQLITEINRRKALQTAVDSGEFDQIVKLKQPKDDKRAN